MICTISLFADSWSCPKILREYEFQHKKISCKLRSYCGPDTNYPDAHIMCINFGGETFFRNLGASQVKISPNGDFILGVSNSGLDKHALWLLSSEGRLIHAVEHYHQSVKYCDYSITVNRTWISLKDFNPDFKYVDGKLVDIEGQLCSGKKSSILTEQTRDRLGKNELQKKADQLWEQVHELRNKDLVGNATKKQIIKNLSKVPIGVCGSKVVYEDFNGKGGWVLYSESGLFSPNTEGECR